MQQKQLEMEKKIEEAEAETAAQISAAQAAAAASAEEAAGSRAAAADAAAEINAMKEQLAVAESTEAQFVEQCTNALKLKESQKAESAAAAAKLQQQAAAFNVQLKARHADALKSLSAEFKREAAARKAANKQAICLGAQLQRAEEKAAELAAKLAQMSEQLEAQRVAQLKAEVAAKQSEERSHQLKTELQGMKDAKAAAEEEAQRSQAELKAMTEAMSNLHLQPPPRAPAQQPRQQACEDATPAREAPCALPPTEPIQVLSCNMSSAAEDPPILPPPPPRPLPALLPAVSAPPQLTAPPEHVPAHAARPAAATYLQQQQQQQQKEWPGEDEPIQDNNAKELNGSVPDSAKEGSCLHPSDERSQAASYKGTFNLPVGRQQAPRRKATAWDLCNGPEPGYITEMRCRKKAAKARRRAKKNRVLRPVAGRVAKNVGAQFPAQMQGPAHGRKSSQSQGSSQFQLPLHPPAQLPAQPPDQAPAQQGDDISSGAPGWQGWVPEPEEGWGGGQAEEAPYQLGTAQQPDGMPTPLEQPQQRQQESVGSEERKMEPSGGQPLTCNGADMQRAVIKFERLGFEARNNSVPSPAALTKELCKCLNLAFCSSFCLGCCVICHISASWNANLCICKPSICISKNDQR